MMMGNRLNTRLGDLPPGLESQLPGVGQSGGAYGQSLGPSIQQPEMLQAPSNQQVTSSQPVSTPQQPTAGLGSEASRYGTTTYQGNGASVLVSPGKNRRYIMIQNFSASDTIYVGFGQAALEGGFQLGAGAVWTENVSPPNNDIYLMSVTGCNGVLVEGV